MLKRRSWLGLAVALSFAPGMAPLPAQAQNNVVIFADLTTNRPIELVRGPSADDEAPENFIGRFAKTWKEKDPSARQYLLEENALPVLTRPEQIVVATVKS